MKVTLHEKNLLVKMMPVDRNGLPILPWKEYETVDGVRCRPMIRIIWDATITDGHRERTCTEADVYRYET